MIGNCNCDKGQRSLGAETLQSLTKCDALNSIFKTCLAFGPSN